MITSLARKLFGSSNDRTLAKLQKLVQRINALEAEVSAFSDFKLQSQTELLRQELAQGKTIDDILPQAFAVVREAAKRVLGQRHFDVQLMGGIVLHQGRIAEMRTGEGKTLVATLPVYLNALSGKGVHVVTVNDYLAKRDSAWMGQVYNFLGLSVSCIVHGLNDFQRRDAYAADITYGTNNEFGFDYLRDNMKFSLNEMVQRPFHYAIVDEVDSILIDEARTPLIISGPAQDSSELYRNVNRLMPLLQESDFERDEKMRTVVLTEAGMQKAEGWLAEQSLLLPGGLYDAANVAVVHHLNQALRAHKLFARDVDYIVKDDKVVIVDEFTGRMMEGRRYSDGLHQALEAREGVTIQRENQTLASITFQNYFRLYPKLAGMTGTALTEAAEFAEIYNLDVVEMPTNRPVMRLDAEDEIYRTANEKYQAIIKQIEACRAKQQPVLVGTASIEKSELLAELFKKHGIPHHVLNARHHEQEAFIISQAGRPGAITIATNMAGRGTDIQLGGNIDMRIKQEAPADASEAELAALREKITAEVAQAKQVVLDAGGLCIIGTERHESRRIDNQLRGRSGRQGDPGASKFYLSLEDDLMRIFGSDKLSPILQSLGLKEGEVITHPLISKALQRAQTKVEARNFDIRKNLLKFDNIMNDQRQVVYSQRREIMASDTVSDVLRDMRHEVLSTAIADAMPPNSYPEQWELPQLQERLRDITGLDLPIIEWGKQDNITEKEIAERVLTTADETYARRVSLLGIDRWQQAEKAVLLQLLDQNWKEHLQRLDHLRQGIVLRAYAQRDPFNEYSREAFELFRGMLNALREDATRVLLRTEPRPIDLEALSAEAEAAEAEIIMGRGALPEDETNIPPPPVSEITPIRLQPVDLNNPATWGSTPRNAPCPCGSGKKYKHCHGR